MNWMQKEKILIPWRKMNKTHTQQAAMGKKMFMNENGEWHHFP